MIYFRDNYDYKNITGNKTAKKRCINENISFIHFNRGNIKTEFEKTTKAYSSSKFKKRLIKEGILEEKCSKCGLGNTWQENPIVLQLEHIDGDHYNNEIENLTILCPNCHSQTSTWCGKNVNSAIYKCIDCDKKIKKGSIRCGSCAAKKRHVDGKITDAEFKEELVNISNYCKCLDCNKDITYRSTRCPSCASKQQTRKVPDRPSLEQIENDLQELKTYTAVGRKYGVSDNCIRKWIKSYKDTELN